MPLFYPLWRTYVGFSLPVALNFLGWTIFVVDTKLGLLWDPRKREIESWSGSERGGLLGELSDVSVCGAAGGILLEPETRVLHISLRPLAFQKSSPRCFSQWQLGKPPVGVFTADGGLGSQAREEVRARGRAVCVCLLEGLLCQPTSRRMICGRHAWLAQSSEKPRVIGCARNFRLAIYKQRLVGTNLLNKL